MVSRKSCQLLRTLGSKGKELGRFRSPEGLACSDNDPEYSHTVLYVSDSGNDRVQVSIHLLESLFLSRILFENE